MLSDIQYLYFTTQLTFNKYLLRQTSLHVQRASLQRQSGVEKQKLFRVQMR